MASNLAVDIREAFGCSRAALAEPELDLVERTRASRNAASGERDRLLRSVIEAYRLGDRRVWAAVLLDLLTPAILERIRLLRAEPPAIDAEDIRSQFVVELLNAAAVMPLPPDARFVERRLVLRASQGARRWLSKERRWRATCQPLERLALEDSK